MTPEGASALVARWVRLYTRNLPTPLAERRAQELAADLHDHIAHQRRVGTPERHISYSIVSRMVRGMGADVAWRRHAQNHQGDPMRLFAIAIVAGLGVAFLALVTDSPLILLASIALIAGASLGAFVAGVRVALERNFIVPFVVVLGAALVVAAIAVGAIVWGASDDAPGLVLFGSVVIATAITGVLTFGLRSAQRTR